MFTTTTDYFAEVRSAIRLSQYVETHYGATLRPRGQGKFSTACPVHGGDNTTAFAIDDNKGLWHCFSQCGQGGDIFTLYRAKNPGATNADALAALAADAGVTLPERERTTDRRALYQVMRKAAELFEDALVSIKPYIGDTTGAESAYRWISETRGVSDDDMELAQLGFVPDFPGLRAALEDELGSSKVLLECGLLVEAATGGLYCPFAGRLVFPIRDERNRVVGFGARVVPEVTRRQDIKFINTRQTAIYDKSNVLYGMEFISRDTTQVVVCEGYMDALAVNALDVPELVGVAACGTSITRAHVDLLLDLLDEDADIVFAMDGDEAGKKSMARLTWALPLLEEKGFGVLFDEGTGKDPWERYIAGTLEADLGESKRRPLVDTCMQALRDTVDSDEEFDKAVCDAITEAKGAQTADDLLRAAAVVRKESVSTYGEMVRRADLGSRTRRGGRNEVTLSPPVRNLVARLMQISPAELVGLASCFSGWDERARGFTKRWLPVQSESDISALGYVLSPHAEVYDSDVVQSVSACMSESEALESIEPTVRAMAKSVLSAGNAAARDLDPAVLARVKAVRPLASGEVAVPDEVEALALLIDVAQELSMAAR